MSATASLRIPAGRCTRCRARVPGLFLSCPKCRSDVMVSTDTRDGVLFSLTDLARLTRGGDLF